MKWKKIVFGVVLLRSIYYYYYYYYCSPGLRACSFSLLQDRRRRDTAHTAALAKRLLAAASTNVHTGLRAYRLNRRGGFFLRRLREIGRSTRARRATVVGGGLGDDHAANGLSRGRGRPPGPTPFHRGRSRRRGKSPERTVGRRWRPRCLFPVRLGRPEDGWSELVTPPRRY